jgi:hypothetical protein
MAAPVPKIMGPAFESKLNVKIWLFNFLESINVN